MDLLQFVGQWWWPYGYDGILSQYLVAVLQEKVRISYCDGRIYEMQGFSSLFDAKI